MLTNKYIHSMLFFQDAPLDFPSDEREDEGDCEHSFVLKDDLGYVCRVCGVIERGIETIFDFQYVKVGFLLVDSYSFYFIVLFINISGKELLVWLLMFHLGFYSQATFVLEADSFIA